MYTYQTLTEETLNELKVGEEFQIFHVYTNNSRYFPFTLSPVIIPDDNPFMMGNSCYSSINTRLVDTLRGYNIPNSAFLTVVSRSKRTVTYEPRGWNSKFRYADFIRNRNSILVKKSQPIDLDVDDDECI